MDNIEEEIRELFEKECSRSFSKTDYFMIAQYEYNGTYFDLKEIKKGINYD